MFLLLKLSWRNILRNKRRSLITGLAIGFSLAIVIFLDAYLIGMTEQLTRSATESFMGHGQIHAEGFRSTQEVEKTIVDTPRVLAALKKETVVQSFSPRTLAISMISSPADVQSVLLSGINPEKEKRVSRLAKALIKGNFLAFPDKKQIVIGHKLAKNLEVGIGDRVVITVAQAGTGELSQEMFRVGGILFFNLRQMDENMAFIRLKQSQKLLGISDRVHEIALLFKTKDLAKETFPDFMQRYSQNGNEALHWSKLMSDLFGILELMNITMAISLLILFAIVSLTIMNTLFTSLYERLFEFAVLRSIGTRPMTMGMIILFEAACLGAVSIVIGLAIGVPLTYAVSKIGLDFVGLEFQGVSFQNLLYPRMEWYQVIVYPALFFLFTLLVAIYPAVFAAKIIPAKAMRRSM